jgi:hypothetical protein
VHNAMRGPLGTETFSVAAHSGGVCSHTDDSGKDDNWGTNKRRLVLLLLLTRLGSKVVPGRAAANLEVPSCIHGTVLAHPFVIVGKCSLGDSR